MTYLLTPCPLTSQCRAACQWTGRYSVLPPSSPSQGAWSLNLWVCSISWDTSRKSSTGGREQKTREPLRKEYCGPIHGKSKHHYTCTYLVTRTHTHNYKYYNLHCIHMHSVHTHTHTDTQTHTHTHPHPHTHTHTHSTHHSPRCS